MTLLKSQTTIATNLHLSTVQLNSKLTLECVSFVSTGKVSNISREIVASARTRLANQLLSMFVFGLNTREITRVCTNCGMPLESVILNRELPLLNLRD